MTSQTAREALIEELAEAIRKTLPDFPYSTRISAAVTTLSIIARIEAEALARGRMEGAKAMQDAVIEKLDECCEPCFQCNQNVTALSPADVTKGLSDDENQ